MTIVIFSGKIRIFLLNFNINIKLYFIYILFNIICITQKFNYDDTRENGNIYDSFPM